ncbi:aldehyde dehydrogenase family protein [Prescottella sp. R16]|uniref:aldehyde dehydrogenase family protein n=1 Tax=Prescottella sp. R16 TaxID=3064529 RepID=UPI00272EDD0B|nr:aldehyde dehydrogenase family protein [Prescottella sp. R16]
MANSLIRTPVSNPATLEVVGHVDVLPADQLGDALVRAQGVQHSWADTDESSRRQCLADVSELIEAETESLARTLTLEQGKPLAQAQLEVGIAARAFAYFATLSLEPEILRSDERQTVTRHFHPLGVAGLITAWNFPLSLMAWKVAPAVLAGNAALVKPAPSTPLASLALGHILDKVLPAGLVQVLTGDNDLGQAIVEHPGIEKISFTGSTATGRRIMGAAAPRLKRLTLELGGNDAAIVLPDADVESTVLGIAAVAFRNAGQVCIAPKRVLVPAELEASITEAFRDYLSEQIVGDGSVEGTTIGPVNNAAQQQFLVDLELAARADGGKFHRTALNRADLPGYFVQPAVVTGLSPTSRLVREEQFGPLLPILTYGSVEQAVAMANDTDFGLGGSVWSTDKERAATVADRVRSGTRWINQHGPAELDIPFGGAAQSGLGIELGREGLHAYTEARIKNIRN